MSDNRALRILYAAGPGDIIGTYEYWVKGQDDPSQVAVTYSSQFYELCNHLNVKAYVISSSSRSDYWRNEQFILENRPNPFQSASGIWYHLGQITYGLWLVWSAIRFRSKVVIADSGSTYWFALSVLGWVGVRVIPSLHCVLWLKHGQPRLAERLVLKLSRRFFAKDCAAVVAVSKDIADQVGQLTQGARSVVEFLPTYRPTEFAEVAEPDGERSPFRVLFAGRVERNKGVFDLLDIAKRFAAEGQRNIVFEVCGDGSALGELLYAVAEAGLSENFRCHGHCQKAQMRERLSQSHVVIVPTRTEFVEGFNQVIAEAILVGRPVITSSVCPALSYVKAAAVEVPPDDVRAYGDAILKLRDDREFYQQKRQSCLGLQAPFYDPAQSWGAKLQAILTESALVEGGATSTAKAPKRLVIVQYAGDYRQSVQDFEANREEAYYAQRYSVESVAGLVKQMDSVAVICCLTEESYDEILPNGVRAIGAGYRQAVPPQKLVQLIEQQQPTHLIVRMPMRQIFVWAIQKNIETIALFASSLLTFSFKARLKSYFLAQLLNHPQIKWVGSYGLTSAKLLQTLGVRSDKVIPWDFLIESTPGSFPPKLLRSPSSIWTLFYVGALTEGKGVGDLLEAIAQLKANQIPVRLQVAGTDPTGVFAQRVEQLGIAAWVEFLGVIPNRSVEPLMRKADLVIVPSRHTYPEGFPLVIHHALRSRTPIVASDHPMFRENLTHGKNAMIFPAGNATALATCVVNLLADADGYARISLVSHESWQKLRLPVKWSDVLERWIDETPENQKWLLNHSLASDRYDLEPVPMHPPQLSKTPAVLRD
jgi:glycogen synthase